MLQKTKKNSKTTKNGTPDVSPSVYNEKDDICKLILGFHCYQVGQVRLIAL